MAKAIVAPAYDGAVTLEGEAVVGTAGDRNDTREACWDVTVAAVAPANDRAVALERKAAPATRGDRGDPR